MTFKEKEGESEVSPFTLCGKSVLILRIFTSGGQKPQQPTVLPAEKTFLFLDAHGIIVVFEESLKTHQGSSFDKPLG